VCFFLCRSLLQAVLLFSLGSSGFTGANVVFYLYSNKFWFIFFAATPVMPIPVD
jgi:hypothetical protein